MSMVGELENLQAEVAEYKRKIQATIIMIDTCLKDPLNLEAFKFASLSNELKMFLKERG